MSNIERVAILVSLILSGLALSLIVDPSILWILAIIMVILVCLGSDFIVHSYWRVQLRRRRYTFTIWVLPALLVSGAFLFLRLPLFSSGLSVVIGLAFSGLMLMTVIISLFHTIDREDPLYNVARLALNLVSYLIAFILYVAIYTPKIRSLMSATAVMFVSALLSLELLRGTEGDARRTWLYSGIIGLIMGEITWGLNYWIINGLVGGVFLLLIFYIMSGLSQYYLAGRLNSRLVTEFSLVTAIGLAFVLGSTFMLRGS
ncbi:MAG: hypothetical protein M1136_00085 [Chloroflexi bacterium]|nr:hypothetical protein [Chloroflexota bacterium]MCL5074038.1 hypothetical protein [Chloroflexota bacterium]